MNAFHLVILAAERVIYEGECISLVIPTVDGQYGIQALHNNMIAAVVPGEMRFTVPDHSVAIAEVSEGLIKVENGQVLILIHQFRDHKSG